MTTRQSRRTKRAIPSAASSVHSMSWSAGPRKRMQSRTGIGAVALDDLVRTRRRAGALRDLRLPPIVTQPFEKKLANGSRKPT